MQGRKSIKELTHSFEVLLSIKNTWFLWGAFVVVVVVRMYSVCLRATAVSRPTSEKTSQQKTVY